MVIQGYEVRILPARQRLCYGPRWIISRQSRVGLLTYMGLGTTKSVEGKPRANIITYSKQF